MKKTLLTLCMTTALFNFTKAQVSAYSFAQTMGTYTPITGGVVLGDATADEERFIDPADPLGGSTTTGVGFPIGFNFTYNGIVFDKLAINTNGWISLGQSSLTPSVNLQSADSYTLPLSQTSTATPTLLRNRIGGLAMDLAGQTGSSLRLETIGSAPNRTCVIQWENYSKYSVTGDNFNFQIRLNETSNTIDIVYGTMTSTASETPQIGLSGTLPYDFNIRQTTTDWSATIAGIVNTDTCTLSSTVKPVTGQTYTWTVPTACTGTPTPGTASAPTAICSGANFDLVLTGYTSGVSGLTFQWQSSSTLSGTYVDIAGATTSTYTATQTATTYYQCVVTCSGSPATSNIVTVAMTPFMNCYCPSVSSSAADEDIYNVTVGTLNNSSTCSTTGGTGSVLNKYSNYTAVPAPNILKNTAIPFSVQIGTCNTGTSIYYNAFKIFIDYNQNGSFDDAGENVFRSDTVKGPQTKTGTFTIPSTAVFGNTMMRVVCKETTDTSTISACGSYGYGETEDYLVNISSSSAGIGENSMLNNIAVYPNPTTGVFNITTNNAHFTELTISVIDIQGKEVFNASDKNSSSNYNKQINLEGLAKGLYYIKLDAGSGIKVQKLIIQ